MKLYVTYTYGGANGQAGFGRLIITNPTDIRSEADLLAVEQFIRENNPTFTSVFLTFWKTLES